MTDIDYDALNVGAKLLYDTAYAKGHAAAREEKTDSLVQYQAQGMLLITRVALAAAVHMTANGEVPTPVDVCRMAWLAMQRTPLIYIEEPLRDLEKLLPPTATRRPVTQPDAEALDRILSKVAAAEERLR